MLKTFLPKELPFNDISHLTSLMNSNYGAACEIWKPVPTIIVFYLIWLLLQYLKFSLTNLTCNFRIINGSLAIINNAVKKRIVRNIIIHRCIKKPKFNLTHPFTHPCILCYHCLNIFPIVLSLKPNKLNLHLSFQ